MNTMLIGDFNMTIVRTKNLKFLFDWVRKFNKKTNVFPV